jgi:hypothetical protein
METRRFPPPWTLDEHEAPKTVEADIPTGAPDDVVRTVTEKFRTLKFTDQRFELS